MINIPANASFKNFEFEVMEGIYKQFVTVFKRRWKQISYDLKKNCAAIIKASLLSSETVSSILSGKLKHDFGLSDNMASAAISSMIDVIVSDFYFTFNEEKIGNKFSLQIIMRFPPLNISRINGASYISNGIYAGPVPWLEWLLRRGTQVVIADFGVFSNAVGTTRSGGTFVMLPVPSANVEPFRVEPMYAGTEDDNFITRAIISVIDELQSLISFEVQRSFA